MEINIDRLYRDLREYFGTSPFPIKYGALGALDTMYANDAYQDIVNLAIAENFDIYNYT